MAAIQAKKKSQSAGFRFKGSDDTVLISFEEGDDLHGLEIMLRKRMPAGIMIAGQAGDVAEIVRLFVPQIVSWNVVDDDGEPVPLTAETFGEYVDVNALAPIVLAWTQAVTTPSVPFSRR